MNRLLFCALLLAVAGCGSTPPPDPPGVRVELALTETGYLPPVFRWDAPVAARVIVRRGRTVLWEVAENDQPGQRVPLTPPLTYGASFQGPTGPRAPTPRTLVSPSTLTPRAVYDVTVIGYDGAVFEGRFSVQDTISFE
ncbi:MAG: hypothetical protein AAGI52_07340 [Bacteroidota bacterium]